MYWDITLKLLIGSSLIFILLRLMGKKSVAQVTPFDLIFFLILGGILETPLYDPDISLWIVLYGLLLWGAIMFVINLITKKTLEVSKVLQGEPSVLIGEGKIDPHELKKNHIDLEQLRAMLRRSGCFTLRDANYAILEIDGSISLIRKEEKEIPSTLVVDEGRIDEITLKSLGRDKEWLLRSLARMGYDEVKDVFYCEWIPEAGLYAQPYPKGPSNEPLARLDG